MKDIESLLKSDKATLAMGIYEDGFHSAIYNEIGEKIGDRSLADFSRSAPQIMAKEPTYNIFRYALEDDNGLYLGRDVGLYADTIVLGAFGNTNSRTLASEAIVALNLWMFVVHELHQTVDKCKGKLLTDDDGVHSMDEAVAYYIGDGQQTGDSKGHSLYALAEYMGELFEQDEADQTRVNRIIMKLFNQAKLEVSFASACINNPSTHVRLREIVNKIVSQMAVPLLQKLIYSLRKNDRDRVKLYAQSVVPLIAGCSDSTFSFLRDRLILEGNIFNAIDVDDIIEKLQSAYSCLGLTCVDVGTYEGVPACHDKPPQSSLAGYVPKSDISEFSKLDLDLHQIYIFLKFGAFNAAEDLYTMGKHSTLKKLDGGEEIITLRQLATQSARSIVPSFDMFERYFDQDFDYSNSMVKRTLDPNEPTMVSLKERTKLVVTTLQSMVVYMAALQKIYDAIEDCESTDSFRNANAIEEWDRAAGLLIGSMEGANEGGRQGGMMMYGLAKEQCKQFDVCTNSGDAKVNERLITLFYAGRSELTARNCPPLHKAAEKIEILLQIPLIQSTLSLMILNPSMNEDNFGELYAFSRSILPYVEEADRDASQIIAKNIDFRPTKGNLDAAMMALKDAIPKMGVDCDLVGRLDGKSACAKSTATSHTGSFVLSLSTCTVLSFVGVIVTFLM